MLKVAFGDQALNKTQVFEWYKRFREGRETLEDDPRSGRPATAITEENVEKTKQIVLDNRRITVRELEEELGISHVSCATILKDHLGARRLTARIE